MRRLARLAGTGLLALLTTPALADTASPGYTLNPQTMPGGFSFNGTVSCTLPGGDVVTYDGQFVDRWTAGGVFVMNLGSTATANYIAFLLTSPDGTEVVLGHSDAFPNIGGEIYRAKADGTSFSLVTALTLPYDADFLPDGDLVVTADTSGVGNGTDILRVDLDAGTATPIGLLPAPSGPIAVKSNGDVFYGTLDGSAFPIPPGTSDILRWTSAQVTGGTFLDELNAQIWGAGYDPLAYMRFDPNKDRLFVAENVFDGYFNLISARIRRARPNVAKAEEVVVADLTLGHLEFVNAGGSQANLQAYQPADGSHLVYSTTDFFSATKRTTVAPRRPTLVASGPGTLGVGSVTLSLTDGPPDGTIYLVFCPQSSMTPDELKYNHPGYSYFTHLLPSATRRVPFLIPTDSSGAGSFTMFNPGSLTDQYGYQFLVGDSTGTFIGSSNDVSF